MSDLYKAIQVLNSGGIVIFPTDTAYAIGCRADKQETITKLFSIRKRPKIKAMPVLVDSVSMAKKYWTTPLPYIVRRLIKDYWPGAVTVVYTAKSNATPPLLRGGSDTIGLRMPNHILTRALIAGTGVGLVGTSANFAGKKTPYKFEDIHTELLEHVDFVVKGSDSGNRFSTVVDCVGNAPRIIREGAIDLNNFLKRTIILHIDTSDSNHTIVSLHENSKPIAKEELTQEKSAQNALTLIEKMLEEKKYRLSNITNITVHTGPGSFTGLRVGIAVANTLAWALQVPINDNKPPLTPTYSPSVFDIQ